MALAIDASSPAITTDTGSSGSVTSASFTPPAGSRIWAFATYDAQSGSFIQMNWSSSPSLTWNSVFDATGTSAFAHCAYADVVTSQAYTVTGAMVGTNTFSGASLEVVVVTGGETTPLINSTTVKTAFSASAWLPHTTVTATADNSIIMAAAAGFSGSTAWTYGNTADASPGPYAQTKIDGWVDSGLYQGGYWRITPVTVSGRTYTPAATGGASEIGNIGVVEIRAGGPPIPVLTVELWENGSLKQSLGTANISLEGVLSFTWDASVLTAISGANVELRLSSDVEIDYGAIEWNAITLPVTSFPVTTSPETWGLMFI